MSPTKEHPVSRSCHRTEEPFGVLLHAGPAPEYLGGRPSAAVHGDPYVDPQYIGICTLYAREEVHRDPYVDSQYIGNGRLTSEAHGGDCRSDAFCFSQCVLSAF